MNKNIFTIAFLVIAGCAHETNYQPQYPPMVCVPENSTEARTIHSEQYLKQKAIEAKAIAGQAYDDVAIYAAQKARELKETAKKHAREWGEEKEDNDTTAK